tara:strand:- start:2531 stop:3139 length:609 start_codon:yes stop_codon:yes gene_type:complete
MNKRKNILIIGNGRSVLNQELGKYVDNFSLVGRINNYSIDNYSKFIGNKTNIWFNGANQNLKKQKYIPNEVIVFIPPEIMLRKQNNIHKRIIKRLNIDENQYSLIPLETMEKYESISGIKRLTTGTASILWAIDNIETVVIYGFDFFIDSKSHYNENIINKFLIDWGINRKGGKHNMEEEKMFINQLIKEKKVTLLNNYILK